MLTPLNPSANTNIVPLSFSIDSAGYAALGNIRITDLLNQYGSPLYLLDRQTLVKNCEIYTQTLGQLYPDYHVCYAGKAGLTIGIANIMAEQNVGITCVSGGEVYTALKSRVDREKIYFHGNNKSLEELQLAIEHNIKLIIDNEFELDRIGKIAQEKNTIARILIRLKPEIDAHTHDYIRTGHLDSKFGVDQKWLLPLIHKIKGMPEILLIGIHSHIGSQIFDTLPYEDLSAIMVEHMSTIATETGITIDELSLGGGLGIRYVADDDPPSVPDMLSLQIAAFEKAISKTALKKPTLIFEPGRSIIGPAGITAYTIGATKISGKKHYAFIDGGMADNIRPALYQAEYTVMLANKANAPGTHHYVIAGKFCESGDKLASHALLPEITPGDTLISFGTGAYTYAMSSNYNRFCRPAMVLVDIGSSRELVKRETWDDLLRFDQQ